MVARCYFRVALRAELDGRADETSLLEVLEEPISGGLRDVHDPELGLEKLNT